MSTQLIVLLWTLLAFIVIILPFLVASIMLKRLDQCLAKLLESIEKRDSGLQDRWQHPSATGPHPVPGVNQPLRRVEPAATVPLPDPKVLLKKTPTVPGFGSRTSGEKP